LIKEEFMKRSKSILKTAVMMLALLFVMGMTLGVMTASAAEKYPAKAVTVIHGFKAGGGSDQLAQVTQPFLEKVLKQRFVNVYKPGADGAIVWKEVGKDTKPDGYTLTTCLTPKTQLNSMVNANAGYSMADFEPIANMIFDPGILVVAADSKFKTFQDLVDAAKKAPGQIRLSHSGNGGDDWYNGLMIAKLAGISFNMVPFDGDAPAWQAAAGGHVEVCTTNVGVVTGLVQGKKLRGLAVYTEKRLPSISEVPTLKELGVNLVEGSYRGYLAPKGTPKEIITILADGLEKVSADPQHKAACAAQNMVPDFKRGDAFKTFLAQEEEMLRKIAKEMKLIP
jgi:putative tricarboxylic transport membrane protein